MAKPKELKIRPYLNENQQRADWRGQTIVYISHDMLKDFKLQAGGRCLICKIDSSGTAREAVVCAAREVTKPIILMSRAFLVLCGWAVGDSVTLSAPTGSLDVPIAENILIKDVTVARAAHGTDAMEMPSTLAPADSQVFIALLKANSFHVADVLVPGMVFNQEINTLGKRSFCVVTINGHENQLARFDSLKSIVALASTEQAGKPAAKLQITSIISQDEAVRELNFYLAEYGRSPDMCSLALPQSCGLVIDGPAGSGKNDIINKIVATGWGCRYNVFAGDPVSTIKQTLARAREQQPSIVVVRDLETDDKAVINVFADFLDKLSFDVRTLGYLPRVLVLATCVNYVSDVPAKLRTQTRFNHVVTLRIPDKEGRRAILKSLALPFHPEEENECIDYVLENTFGWTAGDMYRLVDKALYRAKMDRNSYNELATPSSTTTATFNNNARKSILWEHCFFARQAIRPAAIGGIDARPPKVQWSDICGYDLLKEYLAHAVRLMTEPSPLVGPPRGILLYGPPGCCKTMTAQAMATAASCNFFSVKGSELLHEHIGESERNVRQLFEKARRAAPAIIFFDELDAIVGSTATKGNCTSSGRNFMGRNYDATSVQIIQALVTEIDGFETRSGVMIVSASNRPDLIDSALLRPGRIDQLHYVGPPDSLARRAIFKRLVHQKADFAADDLVTEIPTYVTLTEGFSGAEIAQAWRNCLLSVSRESQSTGAVLANSSGGGRSGSATSSMLGENAGNSLSSRRRRLVTAGDMTHAIVAMDRQITPDMLEGYDSWRSRFHAT